MNQSWISDLFGCHRLVEIRDYPWVEKNLLELADAPYGTSSAAGMIGLAPASLGMLLYRNTSRNGMAEIDNPNFPLLGAELALAF